MRGLASVAGDLALPVRGHRGESTALLGFIGSDCGHVRLLPDEGNLVPAACSLGATSSRGARVALQRPCPAKGARKIHRNVCRSSRQRVAPCRETPRRGGRRHPTAPRPSPRVLSMCVRISQKLFAVRTDSPFTRRHTPATDDDRLPARVTLDPERTPLHDGHSRVHGRRRELDEGASHTSLDRPFQCVWK
jgi:hypothetical protein